MRYAGTKRETLGPLIVGIAYLLSVWVAISVCSMTQRERVAYRPILTIDRLAHFYHSLTHINGHSAGISDYSVCVQSQLGLGGEWLATTKQGRI